MGEYDACKCNLVEGRKEYNKCKAIHGKAKDIKTKQENWISKGNENEVTNMKKVQQ